MGQQPSFPFFGAGEAKYYEWAEVIVRFARAPDDAEIAEIVRCAPKPIKPSKDDLHGRMLLAGSEQFVNLYIEDAYGKASKTGGKEKKGKKGKTPKAPAPTMAEAWRRIEAWYAANHPDCLKSLALQGARGEELATLEKELGRGLPEAFREFYELRDGFEDCGMGTVAGILSIRHILDERALLDESGVYRHRVPFTRSARGRDHVCLEYSRKETAAPKVKVVYLATDDDLREVVAPSFEEWVREFVIMLEGGNGDFPKEGDDEADEDENALTDVSPMAEAAFEKDIERWLRHVHTVCPIEFAFRAEDGEAGGTRLSAWHEESLSAVPRLLEAWKDDPYNLGLQGEEREAFRHAVDGILEFAGLDPLRLESGLVDALFPGKKLAALLKKKLFGEAAAFIALHAADRDVVEAVDQVVQRRIDKKKYGEATRIAELANQADLTLKVCLAMNGASKRDEELEFLARYVDAGHALSPLLLQELLFLCIRHKRPEQALLDRIIAACQERIAADRAYRSLQLLNNYVYLVNDLRMFAHTFEAIDLLQADGGEPNNGLMVGYSYAATLCGDAQKAKQVMKEMAAVFEKDRKRVCDDKINNHFFLGNLAGLCAMDGDKAATLRYLKVAKKYHPDFGKLKRDDDFKAFWDDRDFLDLFE